MRRRWIVLGVLAIVALGGWRIAATATRDTSAAAHGRDAAARAVPVRAVAAHEGDVRVWLDGIGTVTPLANVTVRTRVDGELVAVHFKEGDTVQQGTLLAEIDPRPFQVQVEQAGGQMARDRALLENAKVDLKRYQTLVKQNSIPKQQLDTQDSLVRQYDAALASDQAQIDQARLQLDYAHITAPFTGRLGLRIVDPGNIVHASDAGGIVTLTQVAPIGVVFTLPEDDLPLLLPKLRGGAMLEVEARDRDGQNVLATGRVLTIDNAIDPATGTIHVKAEFANADGALFPNQFVNARLLLEVRAHATLVPSAAIQHGNDGAFVYVVGNENKVDLRPVALGPEEQDDTSVTGGLAPGELVVVDGTQDLRAGSVVAMQSPDGQQEARDGS
ncbi:MdtA/MuxA family multidrug efflux RND transporter periplasmic adaptor subunit [Candidatus Binatia bacterium]|nr:MdtA/MuxA family multidrug efflux RND transporter periplasmic adaptor subunit [Candidatus Binatia bacterium]